MTAIHRDATLGAEGDKCFYFNSDYVAVFVGPCHHGMARPQVADGGTASDMEGSCE